MMQKSIEICLKNKFGKDLSTCVGRVALKILNFTPLVNCNEKRKTTEQ